MRILYYTNNMIVDSEVQDFLSESNDVTRITERPTVDLLSGSKFDILVSDRSRYIIPLDVVDMFNGMVCNLHPSFLPYNRGDQPLLWAAVEGTPYGVTIHKVSERFDEGNIVSQSQFVLSEDLTLKLAYEIVRSHMVYLFKTAWTTGLLHQSLSDSNLFILNDVDTGSTKSRAQGREAVAKLPFGWETKLKYLRENRADYLAI
jgi:folate-dependent phosphoribosylglycinamide formyltransferase PurN